MSFNDIAGRVLLSLFQQSYKGWRGKFFPVCCSEHDHAALDGFPLYWVKAVKLTKTKSLDELPSTDREVCQILASMGVLDSSILINREYDAEGFPRYISTRITLFNYLLSVSACFCLFMNYLLFSCSNLACALL